MLIVCPRVFAWGWGGDTPRLMQMSRGLQRFGWSIELLCCRFNGDRRFESLAQAFPGRVVAAPFYGPFPSFVNNRVMRRAVRFWWGLRGYEERDDYSELVAPRLLNFGIRVGIQKPDLVFGYSGGHLESFVSAQQFARHFGSPLALEFRDPIPLSGNKPLDTIQKHMLDSCLQDAALVITTTNGIADKVAAQFPFTKPKLRTIYSCYDDETPPVGPGNHPDANLVLVHAGTLFGGPKRNARSLVQAIAHAMTIEPAIRNHIQLRLIGGGIGAEEARALAQDLGIPWAVELSPQIPHQACLEELNRAHVLVVIKYDNPEFDQQIPGKLFQYLGRGKPILGIMRETEAATILRNSGLSQVFAHSDIPGIASALIELFKSNGSLGHQFRPNWPYIRQFALGEMTRKFHEEFTALAAGSIPVRQNSGSLSTDCRNGHQTKSRSIQAQTAKEPKQ